jgi:hypothetical protein
MKRKSLLITVCISLFALMIGHTFFSREVIEPDNDFFKYVRDSHYSWNFFFYQLFRRLIPLITFSFALYWVRIKEQEHKIKLKELGYIFNFLIFFFLYNLRMFFKLDPNLDMSSTLIIENAVVCASFVTGIVILTSAQIHAVLGFDSVKEMALGLLAIKHKAFVLISVALGTFVAGVEGFVGAYIYEPANGAYLVIACALANIFFGTVISYKESRFSWNKWRNGIALIIVSIGCIAICSHFNKIFPAFFTRWLLDIVVLLYAIHFFGSASSNANKLGWMPKEIYSMINTVLEKIKKITNKTPPKKEL